MPTLSPLRFMFTLAAALAIAPTLTGCAARTHAGSTAEDASFPSDPEGALELLERAEADLAAALGPAGLPGGEMMPLVAGADGRETPLDAPPSAPEPPRPGATPPDVDEVRQKSPRRAEAEGGRPAGSPCARACRALASMHRATDHLCGLAGEQDTRCAGARERVRGADERVHAACPACAGE